MGFNSGFKGLKQYFLGYWGAFNRRVFSTVESNELICIPYVELDFIAQVAWQLVSRSVCPWGRISEEMRALLSGIQLCGRFVELGHFVCEFVVSERRVGAEL